MLIGVHAVLSSSRPEADLAFFCDVLKLPSVADGGCVICVRRVYQPRHKRPKAMTTRKPAAKRKKR